MHPERWSEAFRRIAKSAGLPPIKLHAIRHSLARYFHFELKWPDAVSAKWLGHTLAVFQLLYLQEATTDDLAAYAKTLTP
jgi:integrase